MEFWKTHPTVFWWTYEALVEKHEPVDKSKRYAGSLTHADVMRHLKRLEA